MRAALLAVSLCGLTTLPLTAQDRVPSPARPPIPVAETAAALTTQTPLSVARALIGTTITSHDDTPLHLVGRFLSAGNHVPPLPRQPSALQPNNLSHLLQW